MSKQYYEANAKRAIEGKPMGMRAIQAFQRWLLFNKIEGEWGYTNHSEFRSCLQVLRLDGIATDRVIIKFRKHI